MLTLLKKYWIYIAGAIGFLALCVYAFISTEGRLKLEALLKQKQEELQKQEEARQLQEKQFELQKQALIATDKLSMDNQKQKAVVDNTPDNKLVDVANNLFKDSQ